MLPKLYQITPSGDSMTDDITIICSCGAPMTERVNRINDSLFLGCTRFPACTETQKVPAFLEVIRAGGVQLPGFGGPDDE